MTTLAGNPGLLLIVERMFAQLVAIAIKRGSDGAGDKQPGISFVA
ncbi:Uncharacterised protein [Mycobacterium tuberculosis]|uniref:Uncharacterized protein n=1 Tax=Mycobacterium tuberculosis TaxID=1773 RepID=A0A654T9X9_MYCTX|nr:hypothetical protein [Mycobacterium tuberculosis]AHM06813.1 hypothetical protein BCGT_0892 [Mycobacterium tuberculosis variant bovis BCG str. ATCC 35743]AKR00735.1 hypothetical protein Mb1595_p1212 [Mycobacterium tuberculosis variant bovis]ALA77514.1 Uncharacterized protein BCGR_1197 [Mycobacterium tuberculosis variant bovis BCG]BAL64999.1 hypothetical protein ERDMAN_1196 [Mycobacterium tuberculosis str. Erdman = ATCC 35801]AOZ42197.1 hypothetical protein BTB1458_1193 [Mycobacterium tubercu